MKLFHFSLACFFLISFVICQEGYKHCEDFDVKVSGLSIIASKDFASDNTSSASSTEIPHHDNGCIHTKIISEENAQIVFLNKQNQNDDFYYFNYKAPSIANIKRPPVHT